MFRLYKCQLHYWVQSSREYIASQGPLEQTVEDFWRMIWEQNTTTIIMLTNIVELGKIKSTQYWPDSSTTMYGDIAVTLENTHPFSDYIIRTLKVEMYKTNETQVVMQKGNLYTELQRNCTINFITTHFR